MGHRAASRGSWRRLGFAAVATGLILWVVGAHGSEEQKLIERGRDLFRIYCRTCHGESGTGDGPTAAVLKTKPSDLTRLAERNNGEFPFDRVYSSIDGRQGILAHGARSMPIWGLAFQELDTDVNQEDQVRGRILQLIRYLESIQTRPE